MSDSRKPLYIYSLSRLLYRRRSSTPTGIDRLDLRYAKYFLDLSRQGIPVFFVRFALNNMQVVKLEYAEKWIERLWSQWVESEQIATNVLKCHLEDALFYSLNIPKNLLGPRLDNKLSKTLTNTYSDHRPIYINTGHSDSEFSAVHQVLNDRFQVQQVYYIHDLIPIDYPEYFNGKLGISTHAKRVRNMIRLGNLILVNSEYTKSRLERFCLEHQLPERRIEVLHIGVEDSIIEAAKAPKRQLPDTYANLIGDEPYFITIGTIEPRKNHLLLLHIWRDMAKASKQEKQPCPKLVIIGRRGWKNANIIDLLETCPSIKGHVIELNFLKDNEMIALMQNSRALLFPSFEEGWGMPLAEALTLGIPAVCSDIPALMECSQNQATHIDPINGTDWKSIVEQEIHSTNHLSIPRNYLPATWEKHFNKLNSLLHCCPVNS